MAGVEAIGPADPAFLPLLRGIFGREPGPVLEPALPFSVIVRNGAADPLALVGVRFDMENRSAKPFSVVHYADSLRNPEKADLVHGATRFFCAEQRYTQLVSSRGIDVDKRGPMNLENLRKTRRMKVSIDCVAFADGRFFGADTNHAFERIARTNLAEAALVKAIAGTAMPEVLLAAAIDEADTKTLGRRLMEAFIGGGAEAVKQLAAAHRLRIALRR